MINGFEYAWEDINIAIFGKVITNFESIEYESQKSHSNIYGKGSEPVAMGRGKKDYNGMIELLQSEVEAIQAKLPSGKDLTDVAPFTVTVSYTPEGGAITTDQLTFCRISSIKKGMKNGDGNMVCQLPLVVGKINYNVK
jgi:hypothetical protein